GPGRRLVQRACLGSLGRHTLCARLRAGGRGPSPIPRLRRPVVRSPARYRGQSRQASGAMSLEQIAVLVAAAAAAWAAFFATRADFSARRAIRQYDTATKPVPNISFTGNVAPGTAVELEVENLGGTLAAGGLIVHVSDELYAGELILPEHAPARRISLPFVV